MAHTYVVKLSNNKLLRICEKNNRLVISEGQVTAETNEICEMTTESVIIKSGSKTEELVSGLIESEETSIEYLNLGNLPYLLEFN